MSDTVSDRDLLDLLLAVGADRGISAADFDRTFEELDLDSLARAEFAAKLHNHSGVDTEERTTPDATPNQIRWIVADEQPARTGR
jgi:hypothetical protein